jgi:DNA polymerase III epsilon subunit-like protein
MTQIMFDLETLGKNPGCIVLSIGVVEFDMTGIKKEYQLFFDPVDQEAYGLKAEADTVMWWFKQNKEAQTAILEGSTVNLVDGLKILTDASSWSNARVWVNGASFDFPILKALFEAAGLTTPWKYYNECCFRTVKNQVSKTAYDALRVKPDLAHDGLADARAQALTLIKLLSTTISAAA